MNRPIEVPVLREAALECVAPGCEARTNLFVRDPRTGWYDVPRAWSVLLVNGILVTLCPNHAAVNSVQLQ